MAAVRPAPSERQNGGFRGLDGSCVASLEGVSRFVRHTDEGFSGGCEDRRPVSPTSSSCQSLNWATTSWDGPSMTPRKKRGPVRPGEGPELSPRYNVAPSRSGRGG